MSVTGNRPKIELADILDPIDTETFFREYYDRKPLHVRGSPEKFEGLMSWDILTRLLNMSSIWSQSSLALSLDRKTIRPEAYSDPQVNRDGASILRPDGEKVMALLQKGATLIANDIDMLSPELARTADALERALSAKVQTNLYCSARQRQAFNSHFDTHDVFAIHAEGEKVWRVYETRMPHPIRHERHFNDAFSEEQHETQRGDVLMEVTMRPGDVLYLPRGQYHDALASSEGTIHMAFGAVSLIGFDVIGAISDFAVEDEAFRINAPLPQDGREALNSWLGDLADRLKSIVSSPEFADAFQRYQAGYRYKRGGFDLPITSEEMHFELTSPEFQVIQAQGRR